MDRHKDFIKNILIGIVLAAIFWLMDALIIRFFLSENLRFMMFENPTTLWEALFTKISTHSLFARISFLVMCLIGGLIAALIGERRRRVEILYRNLVNASNDGIFIIDLQGNYLDANPAALDMVGYSLQEIKQLHVDDIASKQQAFNPQDREKAWRQGARVIIELIHKNGTKVPVELTVSPIGVEEGQQYVLGIARDISERQHAEKQIRESEERYRNLFNTMLNGFALHEIILNEGQPVDYRFISVNAAFEEITGLQAKDIIGKRVLEVLPNTEKMWIETYGSVALTGEAVRFDSYSRAFDKYFDVAAFSPYANQFATLFVDITDRVLADKKRAQYSRDLETEVAHRTDELKIAQEELVRNEKLAYLGQLAGGVGHELRNPLGVINNAVYYLKNILPDSDEKVHQYLGILETEVTAATKIIADLLSLARIKPSSTADQSIESVLDRAIQQESAPDGIKIVKEFPKGLPLIEVDGGQMQQVLCNLLTNAYQAMPDGGTITIGAGMDGNTLRMEVADTGTGIQEVHLDLIFEPLFTTKPRGIGLGLAISKKLVEAHHGRIFAQSMVGQGSKFTIELPLKQEHQSEE